jgi:hypothetical protein
MSVQPRTPAQIAVIVRALRTHGWSERDISKVMKVDMVVVLSALRSAA